MEIEIRGNEIFSDKDFHNQLAKALNVEQYYGNLCTNKHTKVH